LLLLVPFLCDLYLSPWQSCLPIFPFTWPCHCCLVYQSIITAYFHVLCYPPYSIYIHCPNHSNIITSILLP
jgi:hypothetical protein